ncbi:MAG TPA: ATPase, T2SS/T4P/T4SS family [Tepidisphaeraceae bacterium]|nr:ATPase, T2SS/T4P/T4SS family [Tepidisphaeraceae bacterium]
MRGIFATLLREGLLDEKAVGRAQELTSQGKSLDDALREADGLSEEQVLRFLAKELHVPYMELEEFSPPKELLAKFPARLLLERRLLPVSQDADGTVVIATAKLFDTSALDELRVTTGVESRPVLAASADIERCLRRTLGTGAETLQSLASEAGEVKVLDDDDNDDLDLTRAAQDASIIKFVNQVLTEALEVRATDVHVEPFENRLRVRYRVDGVLTEANIPAEVRRFQAAIVSRLKILSHLDIAEKRLPQDGRIRLKVSGREIDVRVSVIPMLHGEAVVLRILDSGGAMRTMEQIGMAPRDRGAFERVLELPHGIILVTGPTGSGKTTTLYAGLSRINDIDRKIITIEDPVEYQLPGVNQIQVSAKTGLTFARGLRAILRHDPDVVLIGEIRDKETAEIAVQASLTGHLVFSTLHTNDAPGALARLIDMGVEPYLVASSLELVMAQRLVRIICPQCKEPIPAPDLAKFHEEFRSEFGADVPPTLYKGKGCRHCQGTGYRGRQGVFEIMPVTEEIRSLTLERASTGQVRKVAVREGMKSLRHDGWRLVREGRTTVEEVMRVTKDEQVNVALEAPAQASE